MEENTIYNPLVSIVVITYNSSQFVLETLESAKAQTYKNIELIISDDCSIDDTVKLCEEWLRLNQDRFVHSKIITTDENSGIPANCNRGIEASKGEWIKLIAGDDALLDNCIYDNVDHIRKGKHINILFSIRKQYLNTFDPDNFYRKMPVNPPNFHNISAKEQYQRLLIEDQIGYTATSFIKRKVLIEVGLFDEAFHYIEDYPMWLKLTKNNYKLYFMEIETVKHRIHPNAVYNNMHNELIETAFLRNEALRKKYTYPELDWKHYLDIKFRYYSSVFLKVIFFNKSNSFTRKVSRLIQKRLNPFYYLI